MYTLADSIHENVNDINNKYILKIGPVTITPLGEKALTKSELFNMKEIL